MIIDADQIAKDNGSSRSSNMVILGAASSYIGISEDKLKDGIHAVFSRKGEEVVKLNIRAFLAGKEIAMKYLDDISA